METGKELRDKGIQRAINHAEREEPNWQQQALAYLMRYPGKRFQAEDVRLWAYENGLTPAPHDRAWGAVIIYAKKHGIIRFYGYKNVKNPKAHSTPASVWDKV